MLGTCLVLSISVAVLDLSSITQHGGACVEACRDRGRCTGWQKAKGVTVAFGLVAIGAVQVWKKPRNVVFSAGVETIYLHLSVAHILVL